MITAIRYIKSGYAGVDPVSTLKWIPVIRRNDNNRIALLPAPHFECRPLFLKAIEVYFFIQEFKMVIIFPFVKGYYGVPEFLS